MPQLVEDDAVESSALGAGRHTLAENLVRFSGSPAAVVKMSRLCPDGCCRRSSARDSTATRGGGWQRPVGGPGTGLAMTWLLASQEHQLTVTAA